MIYLLGYGKANQGMKKFLDDKKIDSMIINEITSDKKGIICKSPGIKLNKKLENVVSDVELAYRIKPFKSVGITGTNGKTTTTSLISHITEHKACGNIGYSIGEALLEEDYYIIELSSFMLEYVKEYHPNIAIFLNINEAHLDYHNNFESYFNAKKNITQAQTEEDLLIYNYDDEYLRNIPTKAQKYCFSLKEKCNCYIENEEIIFNDEAIININEITLYGKHNLYNVMASIIASFHLGVSIKDIVLKLKTFKPVSFRLEKINKQIYNDGKATNINATLEAIKTIDNDVLLVFGGNIRCENYEILDEVYDKIKYVYAYGEAKYKIMEYFAGKCIMYLDLYDASIAAIYDLDKEVLLYSPGHASLDQYDSYIERSNEFNQIVQDYYKDSSLKSR